MRLVALNSPRRIPAAVVLACGLVVGQFANAADAGAIYDPAVGSRWTIQLKEHSEKHQEDKTLTTDASGQDELSILDKTATGFRVNFVMRDYALSGEGGALAEALVGVLRDVVMHAELDQNGKPVRIENLQEVSAAFDKGVERLVEKIPDPRAKSTFRDMMGALAGRNPEEAAERYLDTVSLLAIAQNAGLKPGEERRSTETTPSPLGGGGSLKTVSILRLVKADATGDKLTVSRDETYDPVTLKEMLVEFVKKSGLGESDPEREKVIDQIKLSLEKHTEFNVEKGMTRSVVADSLVTVSLMGHSMTKNDHSVITLSPAQ